VRQPLCSGNGNLRTCGTDPVPVSRYPLPILLSGTDKSIGQVSLIVVCSNKNGEFRKSPAELPSSVASSAKAKVNQGGLALYYFGRGRKTTRTYVPCTRTPPRAPGFAVFARQPCVSPLAGSPERNRMKTQNTPRLGFLARNPTLGGLRATLPCLFPLLSTCKLQLSTIKPLVLRNPAMRDGGWTTLHHL